MQTDAEKVQQSQHFFKFYGTFVPIYYIRAFGVEVNPRQLPTPTIAFYLVDGVSVDAPRSKSFRKPLAFWHKTLPKEVKFGHKETEKYLNERKIQRKAWRSLVKAEQGKPLQEKTAYQLLFPETTAAAYETCRRYLGEKEREEVARQKKKMTPRKIRKIEKKKAQREKFKNYLKAQDESMDAQRKQRLEKKEKRK